jgi:hypothetical protein
MTSNAPYDDALAGCAFGVPSQIYRTFRPYQVTTARYRMCMEPRLNTEYSHTRTLYSTVPVDLPMLFSVNLSGEYEETSVSDFRQDEEREKILSRLRFGLLLTEEFDLAQNEFIWRLDFSTSPDLCLTLGVRAENSLNLGANLSSLDTALPALFSGMCEATRHWFSSEDKVASLWRDLLLALRSGDTDRLIRPELDPEYQRLILVPRSPPSAVGLSWSRTLPTPAVVPLPSGLQISNDRKTEIVASRQTIGPVKRKML